MPEAQPIDYERPPRASRSPAWTRFRIGIVALGVALPYLSRLPGIASHGTDWLMGYRYMSAQGAALLGAINAIDWIAILLLSFLYRSMLAAVVATLIAFAFPAYAHATFHVRASPEAGMDLLFWPIVALFPIFLSVAIGLAVDAVFRWKAPRSAG